MLPVDSYKNIDKWRRFDIWESEFRETLFIHMKVSQLSVVNLKSNWKFSPWQETNSWVLPHAALAGGRTTREAVKTAWLPLTWAIFKKSFFKVAVLVVVDSSRGRDRVNNTIWFPSFEDTYCVSAGEGQERQTPAHWLKGPVQKKHMITYFDGWMDGSVSGWMNG